MVLNLHAHYHFKLDIPKVDHHAGGKWGCGVGVDGGGWVRGNPEICSFAEPELPSYTKPKRIVQMKRMAIKIPIEVTIIVMKIMMEWNPIKEKEHIMTLNTRAPHTQIQFYRLWWGAADQCTIPDSKVHGANMGPTCVLSAPNGPHFGPINLAIRDVKTWTSRWPY